MRVGWLFCWYWWNCWPSLYKLPFIFLQCLVDFPAGFGILCPSIYGSWFPRWLCNCLSVDLRILISPLGLLLSVRRFTSPDFPAGFGIVCPSIYGSWFSRWVWYFLSVDLRLLISPLALLLSVRRFTSPDFPAGFGIVCPSIYVSWFPRWFWYCLSVDLRLLSSPLVASNYSLIILFSSLKHYLFYSIYSSIGSRQ
jgi:hypothetical protein